MNTTLRQIYNSVPVVQKIADQNLPIKTHYRLYVFIKAANERLATLEEARYTLVKRLAGDGDTVPDELINEFNESMETLMGEEVTINDVEKFELAELEGTELNQSEFLAIKYLVNIE